LWLERFTAKETIFALLLVLDMALTQPGDACSSSARQWMMSIPIRYKLQLCNTLCS
jgi:hypothetical protein